MTDALDVSGIEMEKTEEDEVLRPTLKIRRKLINNNINKEVANNRICFWKYGE